ncbi:MAG: hypothetical protein QNJ33_20420 [Crocosphaera sp.]|nr:hypothetical protein [Crocosphaera sp.]
MVNKLSFNFMKIGLGFLVGLNCIHSLTQESQAATFRLFPETTDALSIQEATILDFLDSDLLSQLIPPQEEISILNDPVSSEKITQAVSEPGNISLESIVSSLSEISLDRDREDMTIKEVPILPQVDAGDVYRDIYDFGTTAAEELSDPISVGVLPPIAAIPTPRGGVRTTGNRVAGIPSPTLEQPSLPRFGGPVAVIGGPSQNFVTPIRQVGLPSATRVQARAWGDSQVGVFFASLPQQEIVDVDTFVRTVYRTNLSDMIKQIDKSLDLTIDAEFNSMPAEVFPRNPMPSGEFNRSL